MRVVRAALLMTPVLFSATPVFAQQQHQPAVGVVMGYPAAIGVLWNVADRFALRPEVSVTRNTADSTTVGVTPAAQVSSNEGWATGVGLSALWYFNGSADALRTYFSPRFAYQHATSNSSNTNPAGLPVVTGTDAATATYSGSASIGAQYSLIRRFAIFGELGVTYSDVETETTSSIFRVDTTGKTISVRSGVGVIVFF